MLPAYDLFMFGLTRCDYTLSSVSVAWAKEWAKTNRVFYIDRPFSIKDIVSEIKLPKFRERIPALVAGNNIYHTVRFDQVEFIRVTPRISIPLNFLPEGSVYNWLNQYNNYVVKEVIRRIIKDYKVENYVYFNSFHPVVMPYIPKDISLRPLASVYQSLDEISQEPYIARHGIAAEKVAMKGCDIAIGTSSLLCERHARENNRPVHLLANAADFSTFENAIIKDFIKPGELRSFDKPVILYTGHYSDLRMDHELVKRLCNEFTDHEVVFVGTYDENDLKAHGLLSFSNLHFTGSRPIESLPAFLRHSSVAIIPYASNTLTAGIYPLKINEYLAAGIPVVSTHFSKDIGLFRDVIYLAGSHEEFISQVKNALSENPLTRLKERLEVAASNSWRMRINKLESLIEDFRSGKPV